MRPMLVVILVLLYSTIVYAPDPCTITIENRPAINPWEDLWTAVTIVESGNDSTAVNLMENAYGIAQIRQAKLTDFNKSTGRSVALTDCLSPAVSREIFMWHCSSYSDIEIAARRWNGSGPMTDEYWNKVLASL